MNRTFRFKQGENPMAVMNDVLKQRGINTDISKLSVADYESLLQITDIEHTLKLRSKEDLSSGHRNKVTDLLQMTCSIKELGLVPTKEQLLELRNRTEALILGKK